MPELPDLVYIRNRLEEKVVGREITGVTVEEPVVLRVTVPQSFEVILKGKKILQVYRRGPFVGFRLSEGMEIIVHPMLTGKFKWINSNRKKRGRFCFIIDLADNSHLFYLDEKRMGKVYLVLEGDYSSIPRFREQGVDILSPEFTWERFQSLISGRRNQVRVFLMDQTALSAIGNAYADEILFHSQIHPKTLCSQLIEEQRKQLYRSIKEVIQWGIEEVEEAGEPMEVKVRGHMRVRNRKGEPCPRCSTPIRSAGVLGHDSFFCPECQPTTRKVFIDWRKAVKTVK